MKLAGDVIYARLGGTSMIVFNSIEAANETLSEKGSIYSDRPQLYFMNEELGWKNVVVVCNYGPRVRATRKLFLQQLGAKTALGRLESMTQNKIQRFVRKILDEHSPERLFRHVHTLLCSLVLDVTYGYKVQDEGDKLVALIEQVMTDGSFYVNLGSALVDVFPWIRRLPSWMPGTGYRELGRKLNQDFRASRDIPYAFTQHQMVINAANQMVEARQQTINQHSSGYWKS